MLMQFDEPGRFGEATAGLFFLLALQVDGDDGAHDEQQADDPGRSQHQVAAIESRPRGLT